MEIWKEIKDFKNIYLVSNLGNVKSIRRRLGNYNKIYKDKEHIILKQQTD